MTKTQLGAQTEPLSDEPREGFLYSITPQVQVTQNDNSLRSVGWTSSSSWVYFPPLCTLQNSGCVA